VTAPLEWTKMDPIVASLLGETANGVFEASSDFDWITVKPPTLKLNSAVEGSLKWTAP